MITMAEGVGFEPTLGFPLSLISSQVPSTTQPPFHSFIINIGYLFRTVPREGQVDSTPIHLNASRVQGEAIRLGFDRRHAAATEHTRATHLPRHRHMQETIGGPVAHDAEKAVAVFASIKRRLPPRTDVVNNRVTAA